MSIRTLSENKCKKLQGYKTFDKLRVFCIVYTNKTFYSRSIKFRLDDTSDITWYNDLVSPLPEIKDCSSCCDSASVLFSCETFDVHETNPRLIFGAFAGHSIEFSVSSISV